MSSRTDPDIRRATVTHRANRVVIRLEVADLRPGLGHLVAGRIRTASGDVDFGWSKELGQPVQGGLYPAGGGTCAAPHPTFDTETDVVRVVVPRSCVDQAPWVRVGVGLASYVEPSLPFVDDARSGRVGDRAVLGPRLRRRAGAACSAGCGSCAEQVAGATT